MENIALTFFGNRISNRLDCSQNVLLVSIEKGNIKKRDVVHLMQTTLSEKLNMLTQLKVDVLICNGITRFCSNKLSSSNIQVIAWVNGDVEEVLAQYLQEKLVNQNSVKKDKEYHNLK